MQAPNEWKDAVIAALVVAEIYRNEHEQNPRMALHDLICWEIQVHQFFTAAQAA